MQTRWTTAQDEGFGKLERVSEAQHLTPLLLISEGVTDGRRFLHVLPAENGVEKQHMISLLQCALAGLRGEEGWSSEPA